MFGVFSLALLLVLFFAVKFVSHAIWLHDPAHQNPDLEAWMRPRYVAMTYHVPPKVMREDILRIGPPPKDRGKEPITMGDIAAQRGITLEELTQIVRDGAGKARAEPHK